METNEFDAVFLKSYQELSPQEKEEMKDMFGSEEEFLQMKMVLHSIQDSITQKEKVVQPSAATKERLDHLFHKTYQNKGVLWYNQVGVFFINPEKNWYQQNLSRIAAVLLLGLLTIPFFTTDLSGEKPTLAKLEKAAEKNNAAETKEAAPAEEAPAPQANLVFGDTENNRNAAINEDLFRESGKMPMSFDLDAETPVFEPKVFAFSTDEVSTVAGSTFVNHPDGVFKDVVVGDKDVPQFNVKDNQFVLDLITASY